MTPWDDLPIHIKMTYQSQAQYEQMPKSGTNMPEMGTDKREKSKSLAERYPQYYKSVRHLEHVDVYRVHELFGIDDLSGCLQHASKKILLSGVRTGGKPKIKDIMEARDTLTRWLEMQPEDEAGS